MRIGIIGAGGRGANGYVKYFPESPVPAVLSAMADPLQHSIEGCLETVAHQDVPPAVYRDWREMLRGEPPFDGMIIATPNHLHHAPAMACLDAGVRAIALEKPLATTPGDCDELVREADRRGVPLQLGFVLRSAPFYRTVKDLIEAGTIGNVIAMQADELVSPRVSSVNFRGPWRRRADQSGGSLLEKCCHDMDLLNWLTASRPITVSSFGGRRIFEANASLPDQCTAECPASDTCHYFCGRDHLKGFQGSKKVENVCIYNSGADVVDHQSVQIAYENGVVCNFLLSFNTDGDRSARNLHVIGTRGRLWGNMAHKVVYAHDVVRNAMTEHPLTVDDSGHGGSNRTHALEFLRLAAGLSSEPVASAHDAYLSAMLCFAADRSRVERRQVRLRYPSLRGIEMV